MSGLWYLLQQVYADELPFFFHGALAAGSGIVISVIVAYFDACGVLWRTTVKENKESNVNESQNQVNNVGNSANSSSISSEGIKVVENGPQQDAAEERINIQEEDEQSPVGGVKTYTHDPIAYIRETKNAKYAAILVVSILPWFFVYWMITLLMFAIDDAAAQSVIVVLFALASWASRIFFTWIVDQIDCGRFNRLKAVVGTVLSVTNHSSYMAVTLGIKFGK